VQNIQKAFSSACLKGGLRSKPTDSPQCGGEAVKAGRRGLGAGSRAAATRPRCPLALALTAVGTQCPPPIGSDAHAVQCCDRPSDRAPADCGSEWKLGRVCPGPYGSGSKAPFRILTLRECGTRRLPSRPPAPDFGLSLRPVRRCGGLTGGGCLFASHGNCDNVFRFGEKELALSVTIEVTPKQTALVWLRLPDETPPPKSEFPDS
jgi:hypothetical protein